MKPYLVPLLPTFHGMENENPYNHIREFEEVCATFKEGAVDMEVLKLKAFPLTLKDKAKIWLNTLRPRTIRNWGELQAGFLKKFFSTHETNNLKRQIYTFAAHDDERFYQYWERFMETISACPHHGFDTWMLVNHFYDGMSPSMKQLLETMCGGDFLSKNPDEAMDFLNFVAETSKGWDEPNPREVDRFKPPVNQRGGMYALSEDMELKAKVSTLARRLEELERKRVHEVQAVTESHAQVKNCFNCQSTDHPENHVQTPILKMHMWWAKTSCKQMLHMATHTTPTGGVTLTFPGNLNLLYMYPQEHNSSILPPLHNISKHPPPLLLSKPF